MGLHLSNHMRKTDEADGKFTYIEIPDESSASESQRNSNKVNQLNKDSIGSYSLSFYK